MSRDRRVLSKHIKTYPKTDTNPRLGFVWQPRIDSVVSVRRLYVRGDEENEVEFSELMKRERKVVTSGARVVCPCWSTRIRLSVPAL